MSSSELLAGAKRLSCAPAPAKSEGKGVDNSDEIEALIDLYNKHDGDLDKIFDTFSENPNKAKKYPPRNATEFAEKYHAGYYTYDAAAAALGGNRRAEAK